jgi:hypothetical protein
MDLRVFRLIPLLVLALPASLAAQLPVSLTVEARAGYAVPTGDFANSAEGFVADAGPALGVAVVVHPIPALGVFVGYQQLRFGCAPCAGAGLDDSAVLAGTEGGLHVSIPVEFAGAVPWLRASALYHSLAFSGMGDRMTSDPAFGFGGAAGVSVPVLGRLEVSPGIRFMAVPAHFDFTVLPDRSVDVTAVSFDLGFAYSF